MDSAGYTPHAAQMSFADDVIRGYAKAADALIEQYDAVPSAAIYATVRGHFPAAPARALDVGTGNGRDAAWLIELGYDVCAVDPVPAFVAKAKVRVPGAQVAQDCLPALGTVQGPFDLILVNAVWQHVDQNVRATALARLAKLLRRGGRLILSLRHGPGHVERPVASIDPAETVDQARRVGLTVLDQRTTTSLQSGNIVAGVTWTWLVLANTTELGSADGVPVRTG